MGGELDNRPDSRERYTLSLDRTARIQKNIRSALDLASSLQMHMFARQLQAEKRDEEALRFFRENQTKGINMKFASMHRAATLVVVCLLVVLVVISKVIRNAKAADGPTAENVMASEDALARAMRENDANGIARWLSDDWAVISGKGGVGEGKSIFPEGIKQGYLTRKTFAISEPRVRLYGDVAFATTKLKTSGMFGGKPFDVTERQTDIWVWKDGGWKCVLTHETLEDLGQ